MTFTEAAAEVLRLMGKPLHYKDITELAIQRNLLSHVGKSPEVTMGSRLAALLKKGPKENPLVRIKPGVFALRSWEESGPPGPSPEALAPAGPRARAKSPAAPAETPSANTAPAKVEPNARTVERTSVEAASAAEEAASSADIEAGMASVPEPPAPVSTERAPSSELGAFDGFTEPSRDVATMAAENRAEGGGMPEASSAMVADSMTADLSLAPPVEPAASVVTTASEGGSPRGGRPDRSDRSDRGERAERAGRPERRFQSPTSPDEAMRADLAAAAVDVFSEEEDDDKPILGEEGVDDRLGSRRRRRRRRGRGEAGAEANPVERGLPSYTVSPAYGHASVPSPAASGPEEAPEPRPEPRREPRRDERPARPPLSPPEASPTGEYEESFGRDMADFVASLVASYDRNAGPVPLRVLAEAAQRRARQGGEASGLQSHIAAAVRADNLRRSAAGQRPRFRLASGRVGLTEWVLGPDLLRLETEALAAVERYRDAARRVLSRKLGELPPNAFVEICLTLFERLGVGQLRALRRPGTNASEAHFCAIARGAAGGETKVGVVVRRDGRELSRERVIELRGSLHHYGPATAGILVSAGQALSGARDEAAAVGVAPVTLIDGAALAKACEEHDVAVVRTSVSVSLPDVDLLDAIRGA